MKAIWNNEIIAESDDTIIIEGNHYFPADSINKQFFAPSQTHTVCGWKGTASYYDLTVNGKTNKDAAWFYPERKPKPKKLKITSRFGKALKSQRENSLINNKNSDDIISFEESYGTNNY